MCDCVSASVFVCHLSFSAVLWFDVREAEVCQAAVTAAVHRSIQTLEGYKEEENKESDGLITFGATQKQLMQHRTDESWMSDKVYLFSDCRSYTSVTEPRFIDFNKYIYFFTNV